MQESASLLQALLHLELTSQSRGAGGGGGRQIMCFPGYFRLCFQGARALLVLFTLALGLELSPFQNVLEGDRGTGTLSEDGQCLDYERFLSEASS